MIPPADSPAEHLLERAGSDPEFEAKLRAAYQGRHDVLDALWWAAHPLTSTPRGVADPASELRRLQGAAFSRSGDRTPAEVNEAAHRLHEAERMLAEDARQLADALAAVHPAQPAEGTTPGHTPATEGPARPRQKVLVPLLSVLAVLAAVLAFPTISGINADADIEPSPTATTPERVKTQIITLEAEENVGDPVAIFERAYTPADRPSSDLRWTPEAYRALPELVSYAELYVARGPQPESICLVVVRDDESASTCTTEAEFVALRLGFGRYEINRQMTVLTESYQLLSDGTVRHEATARVTGDEFSTTPAEILESE